MTDDMVDDAGSIDLRAIWGSVVKYRWLIAAVALATTVAVGLWSLKLPKVYQATATLEFDPNPPRPLGQEIQDVSSPTSSYYASKEWLATQQEIITSRQVCEAVVRELGLHRDPEFFRISPERRDSWSGETVERAA
ncbi:MAG: Wzz/FepE/Etk N-terminal domain-containing protein, partial [Myxococcota bacterium]